MANYFNAVAFVYICKNFSLWFRFSPCIVYFQVCCRFRPLFLDVLHENFWEQPKVPISKLLWNLENYSDLLVCYRTADCFLFTLI